MCVNPLICYFTSFYSETLFFLTQVASLYCLQNSMTKHLKVTNTAILLSFGFILIGCCIRSNGFLSIGYPVYYCLMLSSKSKPNKITKLFTVILKFIPLIIISVLPFVIYNLWGFHSICSLPIPDSTDPSKLCSSYKQSKLPITTNNLNIPL